MTVNTASATRLQDYALCLGLHSTYAFMWVAECVKQAGNWFTFVAAYAVINQLSASDAALHTALFLICRRLPYLLLFPLTGLAADRANRGLLLVAVCLVQGAVSLTLPLVQLRSQIGLLYPLIFLQYSAQAFYDPARTATIPTVVSRKFLCVAGTLDTFGFSLMAIGGASVAGRTAAAYGTAVCFRIEGLTFLIAAALLLRLVRARPAIPEQRHGPQGVLPPHKAEHRRQGAAGPATGGPAGAGGGAIGGDADATALPVAAAGAGAEGDDSLPPELQPLLEPRAAAPYRRQQQPPSRQGRPSTDGAQGGSREVGEPGGPDGGCGGCGALGFLAQRRNWDVAVLVWAKATGAMCWGAADVLNGRFSHMPSMQGLGGPDQTLGYILVAVGLGSIAGPLLANALTPGVARFWRVSIACAFMMLTSGYLLMSAAGNILAVLAATAIRTSGSNTIFVHSMAIMQHRLHEGIRGRLFALEFVLYTVSESGSTLFGGFAMDHLGWSTRHLCTVLAVLATSCATLWGLNARLLWNARDACDAELREALLAPEAAVCEGQGQRAEP